MKLTAMVLILGMLWQYQQIAVKRSEIVSDYEIQKAEIDAYNAQILETQNESAYKDGIYQGTGMGFGGDITVEITIKNKKITQIEVLDASGEDSAYFEQAKELLSDILLEQSGQADTVSGATFSSQGLIDAVNEALEKAVK
jgi:uncharacterized protein with FMN-binding domain